MRRGAWLVAMLASCDDGGGARSDVSSGPDSAAVDGTPDTFVDPRFDMDVFVSTYGVGVSLRGRFAEDCPEFPFPHENECTRRDDLVTCSPSGAPCAVRLQLVRGDVMLAEDVGDWIDGSVLRTDAIAEGDQLVVSACDDLARIPLPLPIDAVPVIHDITADDEAILLSWSRDPTPTGTLFTINYGHDIVQCHTPAPGPARMARRSTTEVDGGEFYLSAMDRLDPVATPWGTAYRWSAANAAPLASPPSVVIPVLMSGWWDATVLWGEVTIETDGTPLSVTSYWRWWFRFAGDGSLRMLIDAGVLFRNEAGDSTDTLTARLAEGECVGGFPHVVPSDDMALSLDGNLTVVLDTGSIPVTCPGETSPTHTVRLALDAQQWIIARPVEAAP